jgi:hypothetical protein
MAGRNDRVRWRGRAAVTRLLAAAAVAALTAGLFSVAGAARASTARPAGGIRAESVLPGAATSKGAEAAKKAPPPSGCFYIFPDCVSSSLDVGFGFASVGDTTGCTFQATIDWGDKTPTETKSFKGGKNGQRLVSITHKYAKPGSYPVTGNVAVTAGSCNPFGSFSWNVTLITAGIYADFTASSQAKAATAVASGWSLLANVAGRACARTARSGACLATACQSDSFVHATGSDGLVEDALSARDDTTDPAWISYWTPAVPPVGGITLSQAGQLAGQAAASEIEAAASSTSPAVLPSYVGLDFEPSPSALSCGKNVTDLKGKKKAGDKQCWDWAPAPGYKHPRNCFVINAAGWKEFALGWAAGIKSVSSLVS